MNFVNENNGTGTVLARLVGIGHDLLDFLDAGEHRGKLDELRPGEPGNYLGQGGLAHARRAPEDDGAGIVAVNLSAQRFARADQVLLADEFLQRARAHAVSQRPRAVAAFIPRDWLK